MSAEGTSQSAPPSGERGEEEREQWLLWVNRSFGLNLYRLLNYFSFFFVHFLYSFYWILCFEESDKNLVSLVSGKIVFQSVTTLIPCCFKLNVQLNLPIPWISGLIHRFLFCEWRCGATGLDTHNSLAVFGTLLLKSH